MIVFSRVHQQTSARRSVYSQSVHSQSGASMVEYMVLSAFFMFAVFASLTATGENISDAFLSLFPPNGCSNTIQSKSEHNIQTVFGFSVPSTDSQQTGAQNCLTD